MAFLIKWIGVFVLVGIIYTLLCGLGLGRYVFNIGGIHATLAGMLSFLLFLSAAGVTAK